MNTRHEGLKIRCVWRETKRSSQQVCGIASVLAVEQTPVDPVLHLSRDCWDIFGVDLKRTCDPLLGFGALSKCVKRIVTIGECHGVVGVVGEDSVISLQSLPGLMELEPGRSEGVVVRDVVRLQLHCCCKRCCGLLELVLTCERQAVHMVLRRDLFCR